MMIMVIPLSRIMPGGGIEPYAAACIPYAEYEKVKPVFKTGIPDAFPQKRRFPADEDFMDSQVSVPASQHLIQKIYSRWPDHLGCHTHGADEIRGDNAVGPGISKLRLDFRIRHPGYDPDITAHHTGRHGDIKVILVRGKGDYNLPSLGQG